VSAPEAPQGWGELVDELEPHVAPDWTRAAREHGAQPWVRLIVLVDAHAQLAAPRVTEKIATTMAELAEGRDAEQSGWAAVAEAARERRHRVVARLVDAAPAMLPDDLVVLFVRSIEPAGLA
jgi:hypothetical protein